MARTLEGPYCPRSFISAIDRNFLTPGGKCLGRVDRAKAHTAAMARKSAGSPARLQMGWLSSSTLRNFLTGIYRLSSSVRPNRSFSICASGTRESFGGLVNVPDPKLRNQGSSCGSLKYRAMEPPRLQETPDQPEFVVLTRIGDGYPAVCRRDGHGVDVLGLRSVTRQPTLSRQCRITTCRLFYLSLPVRADGAPFR